MMTKYYNSSLQQQIYQINGFEYILFEDIDKLMSLFSEFINNQLKNSHIFKRCEDVKVELNLVNSLRKELKDWTSKALV